MPTTSPKYPTGTATVISGGGSWTNLASGLNADDGTLCAVNVATKNLDQVLESGAITFTTGEIPTGATIDTVTLEWEDQTSVVNGAQIVTPYLGATAGTATSHASSTTLTARSQAITAQRPGGGSWTPADFHGGTLKVRVTADQPNNTTLTQYRWDYVRVVVAYSQLVQVHTVSDDFEDGTIDTAKWAVSGSEVVETGGVLEITATSGYPWLRDLNAVMTLEDSRAFVKVPQRASGASSTLAFRDDANANGARFDISNDGNLYLIEVVAGTPSSTSVTYSATDHLWLQLRHDTTAGLIYWETSPDGTAGSWTTRRSKSPGFAISASGFRRWLYSGGATPSGTTHFDSLNVEPASGPAVFERSAAIAATGTIATVGQRDLQRSAAVSATGAVATSGLTVRSRSAAVAATGTITSSGVAVRSRSAALSATGAISTVGQRALLRSAAVAAAGSIATTGQRVVQRAVSVTATGSIAASGSIQGAHTAAVALAATATITTSGQRVLQRSASLAATGAISTAGTFWTTFERSAGLTAATGIATSGQRDLHRSASLTATGAVTVIGQVEGGAVTHERSAALSASAVIASSGVSFHVLSRAASLTATAAVEADGRRVLLRSAALSAVAGVSTAGRRDLLRGTSLSATGAISTSRQLEVQRAAVLAAIGAITTAGEVVPLVVPVGRLEAAASASVVGGGARVSVAESAGGVSGNESSSGVLALIE